MINIDFTNLTSPTRTIKAKVEFFDGSTLANTFNYDDKLVSITVDRVGEEGKFFGFGICQKATIKIIDTNRDIHIGTDSSIRLYFSDGGEWVNNTPTFFITETTRDETTNQLTLTGYDLLYFANEHTVDELGIEGYSISLFAATAASVIGAADCDYEAITNSTNNLVYVEGANFEGSEGLRDALTAAAEATQTIYYIDSADKLVFKTLDKDGAPALAITKADYMTLDSKGDKTLTAIASVTELGDNVSTISEGEGETQYIRDNPFLELREDIGTVLDNAIAAVGGLTINQFTCSWRGNYLLECGDKISIVAKDESIITTFILNDSYTYNGGLNQTTSWKYEVKQETANNPTNLGEALKQTFAKVDKANKRIDMVVSETEATRAELASLQLNTESIVASVSKIEEATAAALENTADEIATLKSSVEATMTAEQVTIEVKKQIEENGATKVTTTSGSFDERGITVEKDGSEMSTTISDDGMTVKRSGNEVLTANNEGVKAEDLHATTFLIVGKNSRFEDYGDYTACFWIGGSN